MIYKDGKVDREALRHWFIRADYRGANNLADEIDRCLAQLFAADNRASDLTALLAQRDAEIARLRDALERLSLYVAHNGETVGQSAVVSSGMADVSVRATARPVARPVIEVSMPDERVLFSHERGPNRLRIMISGELDYELADVLKKFAEFQVAVVPQRVSAAHVAQYAILDDKDETKT